MSNIKIEKTAGGYKAEFKGVMYYSQQGDSWFTVNGAWIGLYDESPIRSAFITQYIDPPTPPVDEPEPKFKVGDRVINSVVLSGCPTNIPLTIVEISGGPFCYLQLEGIEGEFPESRFALAPTPKVYTGDPSTWGEGVYKHWTDPVLVLVDAAMRVSIYSNDDEVYLSKCNLKNLPSYHRIASSISDILVDGIMEMEAMV